MPTVKVLNSSGGESGTIDLNETIFGSEVNAPVLHESVVAHLANKRQGTQSALTRAEVRGGGIKPFRQKGTGRARQGSSRSPQYEGGGVVFAPKPRDYSVKVNKKARRAGLISAMSSKTQNGDVIVVEDIVLEAPKTKEMVKLLKALGADNALLILKTVIDDKMPEDEKADIKAKAKAVIRASNNIPGVATSLADNINVYDILNHDKLILTKDAVAQIEEVYSR